MKAMLLAAGLGTRLRPLTEVWPKCLMPIRGKPLLEYWLLRLKSLEINEVLVNLHHQHVVVEEFLNREMFSGWVKYSHEDSLFGTAGTLRKNYDFLRGDRVMLIHADNWSCCNYYDFVSFHEKQRPEYCAMTMMVFETPVPKSCGIVELDGNGVVVKFHEKVDNPPGNRANAAVYILEPEVIDWINDNPDVTDFSVHVIKEYLGKIATWKNDGIHKDIGTIEMLLDAQTDFCQPLYNEDIKDNWQSRFDQHPIHGMITKYS